ncbi:MAG: DUF4065 domain-containing protein [Pseudomonadota bacterium]|nr:DUF4065 domain-containing protein [Pseudomonadota bacterium]
MISATKAANIVLDEAARYGVQLTPLQVMKHVYMSHGMFLGRHATPLLTEDVQAWQYGPVIRSLYQNMKQFGSRNIVGRLPVSYFDKSEPTALESGTIQGVFATYGNFSGPALSNLTHRPGSPWSQVWRPGIANLVIPNELIRRHYSEAIAKNVLEAA